MMGRKIVTGGKTLVAASIITLSFASGGVSAAEGCKFKDFEGRWVFSEDGTIFIPDVGPAPFSEIGWGIFDKDGQGYGEGFVSIAGGFEPAADSLQGVPLCDLRVTALNEDTCVATAAFEFLDPSAPFASFITRTITLVLDPDAGEFRYTSSYGDQTVLGTAKKSKGKDWNYEVSSICQP